MTQSSIQQLHTSNEEASSQVASIAKPNKRIKLSVYLSEEVEQALTELYIARYRNDRKVDRSAIVSEAIQAMFEKEQPKA